MKNSEKHNDTKTAEKNSKKTIVQPAPGAAAELRELFIDTLKDIYWAENALVGALPKMAANATSASLASAVKNTIPSQKIRLSA